MERTLQELAWNHPEITYKPIQKIINSQLDIRLGQFTEEEVEKKSEKLLASKKYTLKFGRQKKLTPYFSDYATLSISKT